MIMKTWKDRYHVARGGCRGQSVELVMSDEAALLTKEVMDTLYKLAEVRIRYSDNESIYRASTAMVTNSIYGTMGRYKDEDLER